MPVKIVNKYQKIGSSFSDANAANDDKSSAYPADLLVAVEAWLKNKLDQGVMLEPTTLLWDPDTCILTLERITTNGNELNKDRPFTGEQAIALAAEAGWNFLGQEIKPL